MVPAGRAQPATGSSTTIAEFCSTDSWRSGRSSFRVCGVASPLATACRLFPVNLLALNSRARESGPRGELTERRPLALEAIAHPPVDDHELGGRVR